MAYPFQYFADLLTPKRPPIEQQVLARAATPDEIIASKVTNELARSFPEWRLEDRDIELWKKKKRSSDRYYPSPSQTGRRWRIVNRDETLEVTWEDIGYHSGRLGDFAVNGVPLNDQQGLQIKAAFDELNNAKLRADAAAAKAEKTMRENEQKWNLVESLLGLKRTPEGALVPKAEEGPIGTLLSPLPEPSA